MPPTDRDVRMRVGVEKEGDTEAFREIAEDIGQTEAAAKEAAESVSALVADLGNVNPSDFAALSGALDDVQKALQQIEQADTFEKQKAAVDALESKLESVRQVLADAWTEGTVELDRYEETLAKVQAAQARFADPLVASLNAAGEAVDKLASGVAAGSSQISQQAVQASLQVQRLRDEIEATAASGGDVGQASQALAALEARYAALVQEAGRYRATQQQVNREMQDGATRAQGYGRSIGSVRDVFQSLSDGGGGLLGTLGKVGLVLGGVTLAFQAGYRAGRQLAEGLDFVAENFFGVERASDRAAGAINRWIGLTALANKIAGESGDLGLNQAKVLDSQRAAFERLGIPLAQFTNDLDANMRLIGEANKTHREHADAIGKTAQAYGLLSDKQLLKGAQELLQGVSDLLKEGLDPTKVSAAVKDLVQDVLAELDRLPPAVRGNVQAMAETLGIFPRALEEQRGRIREILEGWGVEFGEGRKELERQASETGRAVAQALSAGVLRGDVLDAAADAVQALVDRFRDLRLPISDELIRAADATGVFVGAMERAGGVIPTVAAGTGELANATEEMATRMEGAGARIEVVGNRISNVAGPVDDASISIRLAGEAAQESGQQAERGAVSWENVGGKWVAVQRQAEGAGTASRQAGEAAREGGEGAEEGARGIEAAAAASEGQAAATKEAADAAGSAAEEATRLAAATEEARAAAAGAATTATEWKTGLEGLPELLAAAAENAQALASLDLSGPRGEIQGYMSDLDALIAKYAEVQAAAAAAFAVDDAGGGAPPGEAAPEGVN